MSDLNLIKPEKVQNLINKFCVTIGMIPTSYKEALTYEKQILAIGHYLENVVYPAINNNAEALAELQNLFIELKDYVDNYFDNLDVQEEINNKLDEMATDGTLAEVINHQVFDELNQKINNNETKINDLSEDVITYPYFDILKNEGHADGTTPNDTIFANAKNSGYRKFYFPQNENNNANYYFTNVPNFNDCEIYTDKDVILNFPVLSGIDSTKNGLYKTNLNIYSRQQNRQFIEPKNESDFYNQFAFPDYRQINNDIERILYDRVKVFGFNYSQGVFEDRTSQKNNLFQIIGYQNRYKANLGFNLICTPLDITKNECIEVVSTPYTQISFGCVSSNNLHGFYAVYNGQATGNYYPVNGTHSPAQQNTYSYFTNIFEHNNRFTSNNDYGKPIKYKLRNNPKTGRIELYVNDNFVTAITYGTSGVDYFGFGIQGRSGDSSPISSDNGFSEIYKYEQEVVPINANLKILLAGDSRQYGYNQLYKIEDIIKNGIESNGVNRVDIDNISVSGWTIQQIKTAIQNTDLSEYDVVIVCTGINNYSTPYETILQNMYDIIEICKNNHVFCLIPDTIPVAEGTDALSVARRNEYYKIQEAIRSATTYSPNRLLVKTIPNVLGVTTQANNIEVTNDGVHPNTKGSIIFAKSIVNQILHLFD